MTKHKIQLFLDSGAYSAFTHSEEIDLKAYIAYLKRNLSYLWQYVALDEIPGILGKTNCTPEEVNKSAAKSYKNLHIMLDAGLNPIPVFHQGEHFSWLEKMLKDGITYIGIATEKRFHAHQNIPWLNKVFSMITDSKGRPLIKTHGFGVTKPAFLSRYPFYSVDSTTWALSPGYGIIYVPPKGRDGKPDYSQLPSRYTMTGVQSKNMTKNQAQFETLTPSYAKYVQQYVEEVGVSIAQARHVPGARRLIVLHYYTNLVKHIGRVRFAQHTNVDLPRDVAKLLSSKSAQNWLTHLVFATNTQNRFSTQLFAANAMHHLVSYFDVRNHPDEHLHEYIATGYVTGKQRKKSRQTWASQMYLSQRAIDLIERVENSQNETS